MSLILCNDRRKMAALDTCRFLGLQRDYIKDFHVQSASKIGLAIAGSRKENLIMQNDSTMFQIFPYHFW